MSEKKRSIMVSRKRLYIPESFFVEENKFWIIDKHLEDIIILKNKTYMEYENITFDVCSVKNCFSRKNLGYNNACGSHAKYNVKSNDINTVSIKVKAGSKYVSISTSLLVQESKIQCEYDNERSYIKYKKHRIYVCSIENCFGRQGIDNSAVCNKHPEYTRLGKCIVCGKSAAFGYKSDGKNKWCSKHKKENMYNLKSRRCDHHDCEKIPSFGYGNTKISCYKHKKNDMISIGKIKCTHSGCETTACHGFSGKKPKYCSEHKKSGMIDIHNSKYKKCINNECTRTANFGNIGDKKATYCAKHKLEGMEDISHLKCPCGTRAVYGYINDKIATRCNNCRKRKMVNISDRRCHNCNSINPGYGYPGETRISCKKCIIEGMIDLRSINLCIVNECERKARYGHIEDKVKYCREHKNTEENTKDLLSKRCEFCDTIISNHCYGYSREYHTVCHLHAKKGMLRYSRTRCEIEECEEYATHGESKPNHCIEHKESNEFDLRVRKCTECKTLAVLTEEKLCGDCDPISGYRTRMAKQREIKKYLDSKEIHYDSYDRIIDKDKVIKYRPDFLFLNENKKHAVILEVDEYQHISQKEDDHQRMLDLQEHLQRPVIFIRYNPDEYRSGDETKRTSGEKQSRRKRLLLSVIQQSLEKKIKKGRVVYLYFDGWNEEITYDYLH